MTAIASGVASSSFPEPTIFWSEVGSFNNLKKNVGALGTRMVLRYIRNPVADKRAFR